jgi:hypothetical protein
MKKASKIALNVGLLVMTGYIFVKGAPGLSPALSSKPQTRNLSVEQASHTAPKQVRGLAIAAADADESAVQDGAAPNNAPIQTAETPAKKTRDGFQYQRELDDFTFLKKKIFLSEEEKSERKRLIANDQLLRSLEGLLKVPAGKDFESQAETSMALDILFEALSGPSGEVAAGVLKGLVQDNSIEDRSLDLQSRKELAGVKAEVLYQWTSMQPSRSHEIQSWLPGPVSQNLWKNVVGLQESNLAESQTELAANHHSAQE